MLSLNIFSASLEELKTIPKSAYQKCFEHWKKRWPKCLISKGNYYEGDNIDIDEQIHIFREKIIPLILNGLRLSGYQAWAP